MTNEEAIGNLTHAIRWNDMPKKEALDMAIKALKQQSVYYPPCIDCHKKMDEIRCAYDKLKEQGPCEDAISRKELLKAIDTWDKFGCDADTKLVRYQDHYTPYIHYDDVIKCIKSLTPVTPQPKIGRWIDRFPAKECKCSVCDFLICISNGSYIDMVGQMKYCPNCGAKMQEVEE